MWTCSEIKKAGWSKLSKSLWTAVLVTLVFVLILGIFATGQNAVNIAKNGIQLSGGCEAYLSNANNSSPELVMLNLLQIFVGLLAIVAIVFLINPLVVGYSRWFLTNSRTDGPAGFNLLFSSFQQGFYAEILGGTAWMYLWTNIWGLVASFSLFLYGALVSQEFLPRFFQLQDHRPEIVQQ